MVTNVLGTATEMMTADKTENDTPGTGRIADMATNIPAVAKQSNAWSHGLNNGGSGYSDKAIEYDNGRIYNIAPPLHDSIHTTAAAVVTQMVGTNPKRAEQILMAQKNADKLISTHCILTPTVSHNNKHAKE